MKTIVYLGSFEMPDLNASANRVLNNAKALKLIGYNVVFCGVEKKKTANKGSSMDFDSFPQKKEQKFSKRIFQLMSIKHYAYIINKYPDVVGVVCYNMFAFQLIKIRRFCKKKKIKVYGDITEWYDVQNPFNPLSIILRIDAFLAMRWLNKKFDGIICVSSYLFNYYKKKVKKIALIPPLIDKNDEIWNLKHEHHDTPIFIYCGFPGKTKDRLDKVIMAFSGVDSNYNFKLLIVGITKEKFIHMYPHIIKNIDVLENRISFIGAVNHAKGVELLGNSDVSLIIREKTRRNNAGFPTKLVECITSGTQFLANDFSDMHFYRDKNGIIINNIENKSILSALNSILDNYKQIEKKNNWEFDYRNYVDDFVEVFNEQKVYKV